MSREYKVSLPLFIRLGLKKPKNYYINLNGYRNWYYHESDKLKKEYKKLVAEQIESLPTFTKIRTSYYIYYNTFKVFDLMNIGSVSSKFFEDALVEAGKIEDDNYKYVIEEHVYFGGVDRYNPRVEVIIEDLSDE